MVGHLQCLNLASRARTGRQIIVHEQRILPPRVARPSRRVIVRSQPFTELKAWQRKRLEAAAELSKKKTNVSF